jgi:hypothetical protein
MVGNFTWGDDAGRSGEETLRSLVAIIVYSGLAKPTSPDFNVSQGIYFSSMMTGFEKRISQINWQIVKIRLIRKQHNQKKH